MFIKKYLTVFGRYLILMGRVFSVPERMRMFFKQYTKDMTQLESLGRIPALLRNSKFTVRVRNANAAALKLYPLTLEGIPTGKVIAPVSVKDGVATFTVDTAKDGDTVYFEIR